MTSTKYPSWLARTLLPAALLGCLATPAFAVLGGDAASAATDAIKMKAAASTVTQAQRYSVQSSDTPAGTTIRQYVSGDGKVFCVTWTGARMPDLQQLFGEHYQQYVDHLAQRRTMGVRGQVALQDDALVVQSAGRSGNFMGRAYVPSLVPAQVDVGALE